jgi:CDGSH-type Zn-finger protein
MKCKACGCEDRWVEVEGDFIICECGHAQEKPINDYDIDRELTKENEE